MHNIIFNRQIQYMVFSNNYYNSSLHGLSKGICIILQEYGLWKQNIVGYCQKSDLMKIDSCIKHILKNQDNFKNQKC